ncbi:AAA family ATPase [Pseudomonas alliivorans]|nr:AAA family ATPase [Pseudomonas alliivorans]MEE4780784.1 AAA family ATPase [Pseudomonas alliivorans]
MKYREQKIDKELRQWFSNDYSKQLLRNIYIKEGTIRGLSSLNVSFDYPITAFAGVNGSGKSTILALVCCAYHNEKNGFKLSKRKNNYYTFSDFFLQHTAEVPPQGITITYDFAVNNFTPSEKHPGGKGIGYQERIKKKGGKWNNYDSRLSKTVVFLGIERIVPHAERSQSRSYSKSFKNIKLKGWEDKVKDTVGFILGKNMTLTYTLNTPAIAYRWYLQTELLTQASIWELEKTHFLKYFQPSTLVKPRYY